MYGPHVKEALVKMSAQELASYILMQRISPKEVDAVLVRTGQTVESKALQELGVYGTFLGNGEEIIFSEQAGHLLRTKSVGVDEGGVATGYSCLDSPFLI
jgi:glutathione synthase